MYGDIRVLVGLSLAGIIVSLCTTCNLLSESVTVFVSSISALLTITALLISVDCNNKLIAVQTRDFLSRTQRELQTVMNSLVLTKIEINNMLQPKNITHQNKTSLKICHPHCRMRILLTFSAEALETIHSIALTDFGFVFLDPKHGNNSLRINWSNLEVFTSIASINKTMFSYEIITNVKEESFNNFIAFIKKYPNEAKVRINLTAKIQDINGNEGVWQKKSRKGICYQHCENIGEQKSVFQIANC